LPSGFSLHQPVHGGNQIGAVETSTSDNRLLAHDDIQKWPAIRPESSGGACAWLRPPRYIQVALAGEEAGGVGEEVSENVGREVFPPDIE